MASLIKRSPSKILTRVLQQTKYDNIWKEESPRRETKKKKIKVVKRKVYKKPKHLTDLSDETKVAGTTWAILKHAALRVDYQE